jgi:hypothetical protein
LCAAQLDQILLAACELEHREDVDDARQQTQRIASVAENCASNGDRVTMLF